MKTVQSPSMLGGSVRPAGTGRLARRDILRPRRFIFSLQAKILVVVLLCVAVPLLLMGAYLLDQTQAALEAKAKESLFRHLFARASEITEWMKDRLDEPARWSTTFIAYDALEARADGKPNAPRLRSELQAYLDDVHSRYEQLYESLFVVDLEGQVVVGSRKEVLEDWAIASLPRKPADAEATRAQDAGKPGVLTPMRPSERLGRPTLLALHRIERAGRVVGYFVARIDTRDLEGLLASPVADAKAHFWLLDREERVLIGAEPGGGPAAGERFAPEGPPSTSTAPVQEGVLPGVGESVYGKLPLPERPFPGVLAATVSREGVYQPLAEARKRLLRAGIPSVFVIFLLAYVLARGMLRPILLLSEGAQRVSAGDLDVHLPVHGRDELADLTSAFNEMARRVRDSRDELAESATALARTNDQLEQAKERFRSQAITDALTGIFNRRHFEDCCCSTSTTSSSSTTAGATPRATPSCAGWRRSCSAPCAPPTSRSATAARSWRCSCPPARRNRRWWWRRRCVSRSGPAPSGPAVSARAPPYRPASPRIPRTGASRAVSSTPPTPRSTRRRRRAATAWWPPADRPRARRTKSARRADAPLSGTSHLQAVTVPARTAPFECRRTSPRPFPPRMKGCPCSTFAFESPLRSSRRSRSGGPSRRARPVRSILQSPIAHAAPWSSPSRARAAAATFP
jgi:HAMP domain-containing protein